MSIMTLKIHEIVEHTVEHVVEEGNLLGMDTMTGESLHPEIAKKIGKTSHRHQSRDQEALRLYTAHSFFEDVEWLKTRDGTMRTDAFRECGRIQLTTIPQSTASTLKVAFRQSLGNLESKIRFGCDIDKCERWLDEYLSAHNPVKNWSYAVKCKIIAEERQVTRYSEETFSAPAANATNLRVLSFGALKAHPGSCSATMGSCRYHNPDVALFPPYLFSDTAEHGFPVLFLNIDSRVSAIVLKLCKKSEKQTIPVQIAQKYESEWRLISVNEEEFRDYLLTVQVEDNFFVFHAGVKTFTP